MAATNYTPIQLYNSGTASAAPTNTNLAAGELALNYKDGLLYYKDDANVVQKIGYKLVPIANGGTGATTSATAPFALKGPNSDITSLSAIAAGTALLPSITPAGDPNTGVWFPAADTVAVSTGGVERMRTDSAGAVGIGISAPLAKLHVGNSGVFGAFQTQTPGANTGGFAALSYDYNNGANYDLVTDIVSIPQTWTGNGNGSMIRFLTSNTSAAAPTEKMRIAKDGAVTIPGPVGIGTTVSPWGLVKALDIGTGSAFCGFIGNAGTYLVSNGYFNGTSWIYKTTSGASMYDQYNGVHTWSYAASGTAGNTFAWTPGMFLDSTGAVTIPGTLYVNSTIAANSSNNLKIGLTDSGVNRGYIGASSTDAFQVINSSNSAYLMQISNAGAVTIGGTLALTGASSTLGYGTGAGGTVTQATSKSTAVTLNKATGQITMHNEALAAGSFVAFYLTNNVLASGDVLLINPYVSAGYQVWAASVYTGNALIYVKNVSAGSLSNALVISFAVIKGATA